jgi:hypothetical protein
MGWVWVFPFSPSASLRGWAMASRNLEFYLYFLLAPDLSMTILTSKSKEIL